MAMRIAKRMHFTAMTAFAFTSHREEARKASPKIFRDTPIAFFINAKKVPHCETFRAGNQAFTALRSRHSNQ
jgi:hypothetical protein